MRDLIALFVFLTLGFTVTYYQFKWFEYDSEKHF